MWGYSGIHIPERSHYVQAHTCPKISQTKRWNRLWTKRRADTLSIASICSIQTQQMKHVSNVHSTKSHRKQDWIQFSSVFFVWCLNRPVLSDFFFVQSKTSFFYLLTTQLSQFQTTFQKWVFEVCRSSWSEELVTQKMLKLAFELGANLIGNVEECHLHFKMHHFQFCTMSSTSSTSILAPTVSTFVWDEKKKIMVKMFVDAST